MPRSRIFGIYTLLAVFALGAGLLVARFFGSTAVLPAINATPGIASGPSATTAPASSSTEAGRNVTAAPEPTGAPVDQPNAPFTSVSTPRPTTADARTATGVPSLEPSAPIANTGYVEYTVQKGDTLTSIGEKYGVTVQDLLAVNQLPNPDSLVVGVVLRIPKK